MRIIFKILATEKFVVTDITFQVRSLKVSSD